MAYATLDDVRGAGAQVTLNATSKPTDSQAQRMIDDTASEIDVRLAGAGYAVPVGSPAEAVGWLRFVNVYGALAAILKSKFPDATGEGETPAYAFWEKRYQDALDDISGGVISFPGTPTGTGFVTPSTYYTRNPDQHEVIGDIAEPSFTTGKVF